MKKSLSILAICLALFTSCKNDTEPCNYEYIEVKAQVLNVIPYKEGGKDLFKVELDFNDSKLALSPQTLNDLKNIEIDSAFVARNKIKERVVYTATVSELIEGNCQEMYIAFNFQFK